MALKHGSDVEAVQFRERRTRGKLVAFSPEIVAEPVPSPAHALQQMLAAGTADGFIANPAQRRRALMRFVGATLLLWCGVGIALTLAMAIAA